MPIVDYNRIYHVQSQERKPVLNPVNVPDAAGAFLRGAVPAAGAAMPGLRARLADTEARYRERAGNNRAKWAAIGQLIGVGKDVGLAYAGAVERRDEADLNALEAAYLDHMNQGADAAWNRPYKRGGDNGSMPDGPLVAIKELDDAFDGSPAMKGARSAVKERFAEWRGRTAQRYFSKASDRQNALAEQFRANAILAKRQTLDAQVKSFYDPEDHFQFDNAAQAAAEWRAGMKAKQAGLGDFDEEDRFHLFGPEGAEEYERLKNEVTTEYLVDRAQYYLGRIATDVGDTSEMEAAVEELTAGPDAKTLCPDDKVRASLKQGLNAARIKKGETAARLKALHDQEIVGAADDFFAKVAYDQIPDADIDGEWESVKTRLDGLDDRVKLPLIDKIDSAVAVKYARGWVADYRDAENEARASTDVVSAERANLRLKSLQDELAALPDGSKKKQAALNQLYPPAAREEEKYGRTKATNELAAGAAPSVVLEKATSKYMSGLMQDEDYLRVVDDCKARLTFQNAVGDADAEYRTAIVGALEDAFGVKLSKFIQMEDGVPKTDKDGNLMLAVKEGRYVQTEIDPSTGGTAERRRPMVMPTLAGVPAPEANRLKLLGTTIAEAFRLGMDKAVQMRAAHDLSKGKEEFSSGAVRKALAEELRTMLSADGGALSDEMVFAAIQEARTRAVTGLAPSEGFLSEIRSNLAR